MENMDSTVISTSLPAIAADIGSSPLELKLAITSYLLALAIFIPASGWMADRYGARTIFRTAIAVFMLGSIGCALSQSLRAFRRRPVLPGHGRRHDVAGRPPRADPHRRAAKPGRRHVVPDHAGADRADARPAAGRLHHDLCDLALDLPDQPADRARGHLPGDALRRKRARRQGRAVRFRRHDPGRPGRRRTGVRFDRHRHQFRSRAASSPP